MAQQNADLDVLIVGAGISGIDAAYHLKTRRPGTRFAIMEAKEDIGGTWHTHRFPGIRSDSDLFTFGYKWKPWTGVPIATAPEILNYLNEAVEEQELGQHIRFRTRISHADWCDDRQLWTVTGHSGPQDTPFALTARFLWMCAGYYRHDEGYLPQWPGMERFDGPIIHPQIWPQDLDHADKEIVVIGSGATAATLVPALAKTARQVTILQRSPTYYFPRPVMDEFQQTLTALNLPADWMHEIMRRKFLLDSETTARRAREEPDALAADLLNGVRAYLPDEALIAEHFSPTYRPWRQRVAMVPDGDLFVALREARAGIVTGQIREFCEAGIELETGQLLRADIIVSATGLNLNVFGDIRLSRGGQAVDVSRSITHRAVMFTGLPNFATVFGYLRSSWTLRADLVSEYLCRLLTLMEKKGAASVEPMLRAEDQGMEERPWIDPENFNPGYIARHLTQLPKQGDRQPWIMTQDYFQDRHDLPAADLEDGTLIYK